jgi:hypothetical protein
MSCRVTTTLGFAIVVGVVVGLMWLVQCGVAEIALPLAVPRCDDSCESLCIDVRLLWGSLERENETSKGCRTPLTRAIRYKWGAKPELLLMSIVKSQFLDQSICPCDCEVDFGDMSTEEGLAKACSSALLLVKSRVTKIFRGTTV